MPDQFPYEYLGDGVYVRFDGYSVELLANDHLNPTDRIALEPPVLDALNDYVQRMRARMKTREGVGGNAEETQTGGPTVTGH